MKLIFFLIIIILSTNHPLLWGESKEEIDKKKGEFQKIEGKWKLDRIVLSNGSDTSHLNEGVDLKHIIEVYWLKIEKERMLLYLQEEAWNDCTLVYRTWERLGRFWKYVMYNKLDPFDDKLIYKPYEKIKIFYARCTKEGGTESDIVFREVVHVGRADEIFIVFGIQFFIYKRIK